MPALLRSLLPHARRPASGSDPGLRTAVVGGCCEVCRSWSSSRLCPGCAARFGAPVHRCSRCALPLPADVALCGSCLHEPPAFEKALCVGDYGFPWDRLIHRLKFGDQPELALLLAERMHAAAQERGLHMPEFFVPVPLSAERLAERGYDQAWELARRLGAQTGIPAGAQVLQRRFDVQRQSSLARAERLSNLRGAFIVPPDQRARMAQRHVALVDDVLTTGATAQAAAQALREAGARQVDLWVVARTPAPAA